MHAIFSIFYLIVYISPPRYPALGRILGIVVVVWKLEYIEVVKARNSFSQMFYMKNKCASNDYKNYVISILI